MGLFVVDTKKYFGVTSISSSEMEKAQDLWLSIVKGSPDWASSDVHSINFGKFICKFAAKKACLDLRVMINGSARADFMNQIVQQMVQKVFRDKLEDACGVGGIILKPNGNNNISGAIDYVMPWNYVITEQTSNGDILGAVFSDRIQKGSNYFTRLEYHHFVNGAADNGENGRFYRIENKAFMSASETSIGNEIALDSVAEWAGYEPEVTISNVENCLFAYLKMPGNNAIDYNSPEGISLFADCIEELKDLDVAWSRKGHEVADSQHITFIDDSVLQKKNGSRIRLPRFVKGMRHGVDASSTIEEHVATLLTDQRIADINSILSMISTKAGFSQGQFVLDRKTGRITATEIESDDSETVETINDIRSSIKTAMKSLVYALDKYCDVVYNLPDGYVNMLDSEVPDEDIFYFKDLMATFEQDRARAYQLMTAGVYTKKKYLVEYEGFTEEEANEMLAEAKKERESAGMLFAAE